MPEFLYRQVLYKPIYYAGLFTWPNQDDRMNMNEISEQDQKFHNNER